MEWFRKETAPAAAGAVEDARRCGRCMHSEPVHGSDQFRLMCSSRPGCQRQWYLVGADDACARFEERVDFNRFLDCARNDGVRVIPLSQGKYALVDEADYAALIRHHWYATQNGSRYKSGHWKTFYAVRAEKGRSIRMHRVIMGAKPGQIVDHINHNGLDNRRCNLRLCNKAENAQNRRGLRGRSSRYKGVSLNRGSAKWQATIARDGKQYYLGLFDSEIAAARAYNAKARELFGEFAYLNDV